MGHPWPLFLYSRLSNTQLTGNKSSINKILPMTGYEPRTSGIGRDRSTNWATDTSRRLFLSFHIKNIYGGREPWSSGYGRRLMLGSREFESLHRRLDGHIFTFSCKFCIVCLKRPKIKWKRVRGWPIKNIWLLWSLLLFSLPRHGLRSDDFFFSRTSRWGLGKGPER